MNAGFYGSPGIAVVEYRRNLPVNGRDEVWHKSNALELRLYGAARTEPCPPALPLASNLDTGGEFLASSHWAEERENHRGSFAR